MTVRALRQFPHFRQMTLPCMSGIYLLLFCSIACVERLKKKDDDAARLKIKTEMRKITGGARFVCKC